MIQNEEIITGITGTTDHSSIPQFGTAEYSHVPGSETCEICSVQISTVYYRFNSQNAAKMVCEECSARIRAEQKVDSNPLFARALIFGIGGAILGMILYATVVIVTGWTIGYLALAVGWLVGRAMMMGSKGTGGRRYQIAAVLLTYVAISLYFIPTVIAYNLKHQSALHQQHGSTGNAGGQDASAQSDNDVDQTGEGNVSHSNKTQGVSSLFGWILALVGLGLISPFTALIDPAHGVINLVILFVGLSFAWRATQGQSFSVDGPYSVGG